jgi:UDP-N-acetylmuramoylalanine--D-glutamate ligase
MAAAAAIAAGAAPATLAAPLAAFRPGPHRLEHVAWLGGVEWVNDSKATNPHAAAAALSSFGSVVWIAGGLDKDLDFSVLAPLLPGRVRAVVTIGACGPAIARLARDAGLDAVEAGSLDRAVAAAAAIAGPGDTVLLAPAAASMDQFVDYADRGRTFAALVRQLASSVEMPGGR